MRITSWNCQGLGSPSKQSRLFQFVRLFKCDILFLIETLNKCEVVCKLACDLGYANVITQPPQGRSGGLALLWKNNVSLSLISRDERLIDVAVKYNERNFHLSCLYGHPIQSERHFLWNHLEFISLNRTGPWLLLGDFNEILSNSEKIGGTPRENWTFRNFRNMITTCDLTEMKSIGDKFTWSGERHSHSVKCCLDRAFINSEWRTEYPHAEVEFLEFAGSDHKPIMVRLNNPEPQRHKLFHFDKRLLDVPSFKGVVKNGWAKGTYTVKTPITDRIRTCRQAMARLKHQSSLNADVRIKTLRARLNRALDSNLMSVRHQIPQLRQALSKAYHDEEIYWQQKSRNQWMKDGDRNTGFFHACTKTRFSHNQITSISDNDGTIFRGDKEIGRHAQEFFTNIYTTTGIAVSPMDFADFKPSVSTSVNVALTKDFGEEEIYEAICLIGDDKAPGPDGLTARFYKQCWNIVGKDVVREVKSFFATSRLRNDINHTNICMIPKIDNPTTLSDYRPIALCNVLYKIISKCLIRRLKLKRI